MRKILLVLCLLLMLGCGKTPNQQKDDEAQIRLREKILHFTATHGASIDWVKELPKWEENAFTAHFQLIFLDRQETIFLFPLEIADLVRKDNDYVLVANMSHAIFTPYEIKIILKCPTEIAEEILDSEIESSLDTLLVAAKINKVRNVALELIPELNYSPEEMYVNAESADIYIDVNVVESHVILVGECIALENIGDSYFDYEELTNKIDSRIEDNL